MVHALPFLILVTMSMIYTLITVIAIQCKQSAPMFSVLMHGHDKLPAIGSHHNTNTHYVKVNNYLEISVPAGCALNTNN